MSTLTSWRRPVRSRQSSFAASAAAAIVACAAASTAKRGGQHRHGPGEFDCARGCIRVAGCAQQPGENVLWMWCAHSTAPMASHADRTDDVAWLEHGGPEMDAEMLPTCGAVANRIYARLGALPCGLDDLVGS